jgi:hypothetical protein
MLSGLVLAFALAALAAGSGPPILEGETHARLSVTVDPDESGTILVPSPFAIVPGSDRVVVHVPESGGIFLLEGERILHHFPLPDVAELHDIAAAETFFVAGRRFPSGLVTVELRAFDLREGRPLASVESRNPQLRVDLEAEELWRVVIRGSRAGVFHPATGATVPLWDRETGPVPSADQVAGATAGLDWDAETKWVPAPDGSVSRSTRGRSVEVVAPGRGEFLDAVSDRAVLLLQPAETVRADADGELLLSHELGVRLVEEGGVEKDFRLRSMSDDVRATRLVVRGRPIRVHDGRIYWIFLGTDYMEIRTVPVSAIGG